VSKREGEIDIDCARRLRTTYMTPFDEGLFGHAKKRSTGRLRDKPALQDMIIERISSIVYTNADLFSRAIYLLLAACCCWSLVIEPQELLIERKGKGKDRF
jgi:hypothetical protein